MAASIRDVTTTTGSGDTLTVDLPAGTSAGDKLVAFHGSDRPGVGTATGTDFDLVDSAAPLPDLTKRADLDSDGWVSGALLTRQLPTGDDTGIRALETSDDKNAGHGITVNVQSGSSRATLRSTSSATGAGDTLTVSAPSGLSDGDLLVACHSSDRETGMGAPSGWTLEASEGTSSPELGTRVWYRIAGSSEPSSYDFTQDGAADGVIAVAAIIDHAGESGIISETWNSSFVGDSVDSPSTTPTGSDDFEVRWFGAHPASEPTVLSWSFRPDIETAIWHRTATSSEPSSYDFTQDSAADGVVTLVAVSGVDTSIDPGSSVATNTEVATEVDTPPITPNKRNDLELRWTTGHPNASSGSTRAWTPPDGFEEQADLDSGGWVSGSLASRTLNTTSGTDIHVFAVSDDCQTTHGFTVHVSSELVVVIRRMDSNGNWVEVDPDGYLPYLLSSSGWE